MSAAALLDVIADGVAVVALVGEQHPFGIVVDLLHQGRRALPPMPTAPSQCRSAGLRHWCGHGSWWRSRRASGRARSSLPPFRRPRTARPDNGGVDHLQSRVRYLAAAQHLQDEVPDVALLAQRRNCRKTAFESPSSAGRSRATGLHPAASARRCRRAPAMVARRTPAAAHQEGFEIRPLRIAHPPPNHCCSPQRAALNHTFE